MKLRRYFTILLPFLHIILVTFAAKQDERLATKSFDTVIKTMANQGKRENRDISLSYSATDIDSKEGARFKTITVIKNLNEDGTSEKLTINPELHKNEHWANAFRDNFDSYGTIPDVPDIDDLFEFMNKKPKMKSKAKNENNSEKSSSSTPPAQAQSSTSMTALSRKPFKGRVDQKEKPVVEPTIESFGVDSATAIIKAGTSKPPILMMTTATKVNKSTTDANINVQKSSPTVDKIKGDAELIPLNGSGQKKQQSPKNNSNSASATRSQSLSLNKERFREQLINVNYSTPQHTVHQYFENYVHENTNGYDYPQPCGHAPSSSVSVTTPSGRTYDIPRTSSTANNNNGVINPYIAPSVAKKPPSLQAGTPQPLRPIQNFPPYNQQQPTYSVNSIVPPLQPTPNFVGSAQVPTLRPRTPATATQQSQFGGGYSTSQRPYVAPNLRNGLGNNRGASPTPIYNVVSGAPNFRSNVYSYNKPSIGRSRGLKY